MPPSRSTERNGQTGTGENLSPADRRQRLAHDLGIGEFTQFEVVSRFADFQRQFRIGLNRVGRPTMADGGALAIRTGIPRVTTDMWNGVRIGSLAYVAEIAGTNWNVKKATKKEDGTIDLEDTSHKKYEENKRQVTFDEFVSRIVHPIAGDILAQGKQEEPVDIGIALGFPHSNEVTPDGIEAHLINVKEDGELPKKWKITDWDPERHTNITAAIREKLTDLGINVRTLVAINDTPAVALDREAIQSAQQEELEVIKAGFVGGTGTNGAVDRDGLVNLELGQLLYQNDAVYEKMKANGWLKEDAENIMELQTGEALNWRLAAGIQLMHENDPSFTIDEQLIEELKPKDPRLPEESQERDGKLIDRIATGERDAAPEIKELAESVLKKAGQVYGAALAAISEVEKGDNIQLAGPSTARAFLVEGGTLLYGHTIRETAEETAAYLRQPLVVRQASGLKGVASLAMTYFDLAA